MQVTQTQKSTTGKDIVKAVDYQVSSQFAKGFYDSCKGVQFGATNGFAMDLIGGGAKNASAFLKYMGDVRPGLGSPFQIDFPLSKTSNYSRSALSCSDTGIDSRCACADCPSVCPSLPYLPPPNTEGCRVGRVSCLTFSLLIVYGAALAAVLLYYSLRQAKRIHQRRYERVALTDPPQSPTTTGVQGMVGHGQNDDDSGPSGSIHFRLGRGASLLDPMEHLQPKQSQINALLRRFFYRLGLACARFPIQTFVIAGVVVALLNVGWHWFQVETDPVRLWVSPSSAAAEEKAYFDDNFGPFYRTEQIFITAAHNLSPLSYDTLEWVLHVEQQIRDLRSAKGVALEDVCFAPSGPGTACVVQSVSAWLGDDMSQWGEKWTDRIKQCATSPGECLPEFGQPIDPKLILGGVKKDDWVNAKALVITYVVDNYNAEAKVKKVEDWEKLLDRFLSELKHPDLKVSYSTGISLEKELNKSANTDVRIVVLSYLVMFLYVSLTLGGGQVPKKDVAKAFKRLYKLLQFCAYAVGLRAHRPGGKIMDTVKALPRIFMVNSKFGLGLFGIVIVLVAVSSSVGLFSLLGVRVTLIIAEVIPFLVLAVGVDNVFILVHELDRQNLMHAAPPETGDHSDSDSEHSAEHHGGHHGHGHGRGQAGHGHSHSHHADTTSTQPSPHPSPQVAAPDNHSDTSTHDQHSSLLPPEERVARAVARMGPSILLSSTTEVVAFALGALVPMPAVRNFAIYAAGSVLIGAILQCTVFVSAMVLDIKRAEASRLDCFPCIRLQKKIRLEDEGPGPVESLLTTFVRKWYAPTLLKKEVKHSVLAAFGGMLLLAIIGMQKITLGLDQRLALPPDSNLIPYFNDVDKYLDVGPPVYFVVKDGNSTERYGQQELCGRFTTCNELSVANTLEAERKRPETSFIANPPAAWIDDFLMWTNPLFESCCRVRRRDPSVFCRPRDSDRLCRPCYEGQEWDTTMAGLPQGEDFERYLGQWLQSPADDNCPLGGLQGYSHAVKTKKSDGSVKTSHFRTFHTPLRAQNEFINALASARRIAADISHNTGLDVFPYSLFYVFFDQYSYIASMSVKVLSAALLAVMGITSLLLGSWKTGATVTFTCALIVVNVMGVMGYWSISLNAISLVNLVISLGIAVEFCSHLARAFMGAGSGLSYDKVDARKDRDERAWTALVDVGPSIFSGITMTKLVGISVLALTKSKLLETYYFRMWLTLIITGALHGLVFLPVLLSYTGGQGYSLEDTDEDWVTSQMRRPGDYESAPFADDDSMMDY